MGWFDDSEDAHRQVYSEDPHNEGKFSHELLAGAASFGAMKMWEDKQRRDGQPVSHAFAKEAIAAIAGAEADKLAETYGKDAYERHEARKQAQDRAVNMYDEHYGGQGDQWQPDYNAHPTINNIQETNYYTQDQWN